MSTKPKFVTKWHQGRLVPVAVEGGPEGLAVTVVPIDGFKTVVYVGTDEETIYRDKDFCYCGAV